MPSRDNIDLVPEVKGEEIDQSKTHVTEIQPFEPIE